MKAVKSLFETRIGVPLLSEFHADVGKHEAPRPRPDKGVGMKTKLRHAGDAGRKRDKCAHNGQKARDQYRHRAVLIEEIGHSMQVVMAHQDPTAIALDQRAAALCADPIGNDGTEIATEGSCGSSPYQVEAVQISQVAGERHDDLGWKGNAGRFNAHEHDNACIAAHVDDVRDELNKGSENAFAHGASSSI